MIQFPIQECVLALPSEGEKQVTKGHGHDKPKKHDEDCTPIEDGGFTTQDDSGGGSNTNPPPPKEPDPE